MSPLQWIQVLAALASALAAGLVWAMRDAAGAVNRDLLAAREAELAALRGELDALRELTPTKLRDFFLATRRQLGEYCARVQEGYDHAKQELVRCDAELARLQDQAPASDACKALALRREELAAALAAMKGSLRELQHQADYPDPVTLKFPTVNPTTVQALTRASLALSGPQPALEDLSATLAATFKYRLDEHTLFSHVEYALPEEHRDKASVWQRPDNGE